MFENVFIFTFSVDWILTKIPDWYEITDWKNNFSSELQALLHCFLVSSVATEKSESVRSFVSRMWSIYFPFSFWKCLRLPLCFLDSKVPQQCIVLWFFSVWRLVYFSFGVRNFHYSLFLITSILFLCLSFWNSYWLAIRFPNWSVRYHFFHTFSFF